MRWLAGNFDLAFIARSRVPRHFRSRSRIGKLPRIGKCKEIVLGRTLPCVELAVVSTVAKPDEKRSKCNDRQYSSVGNCAQARSPRLENAELRSHTDALRRNSSQRRSGAAAYARKGGCEVGREVHPEPQLCPHSLFVARPIVKQLHRLVPIGLAKLCGIEAKQQGVYLLRHNPPSESSWRAQRVRRPRVSPPLIVPAYAQWQSTGSTVVFHVRVPSRHAA